MELQTSHSVVYSKLNKAGQWIDQKGKVLFHMTFPHGEACDSEQYNICVKVPKEGILQSKKGDNRESPETVVRVERSKNLEAEVCPDHIHMLVEIPPKLAVASFMGYLKGKGSTMLYEQFGELKYKYRSREFWCRGYYVDTAGKNTRRIQEYIQNQLTEDEMGKQLTMQPKSPFAGGKQQQNAAGRPHLRVNAREEQRAMPAYEMPPASRGGGGA